MRLREALDIGDVVRCPDLSKAETCSECFLREDGTHWPYCSKFVAPDNEVMRPVSRHTHTHASGGDANKSLRVNLCPV